MLDEVRLPSGKLVSSLKVKELQKELNKRRLSSIGKKSELASRLVEFLSSTEQLLPEVHSQHCRFEVSKEESSENINCEDINSTFNKSGESAGNEINSWKNETFEIIEGGSNEAENLEGNSIRTPKRESFISKLNIKSRKSSRKSRINVLDIPYAESNALNERGRRSNTPKSSRKSIQEHSPQQLHHSFMSYDGAEENNPIKVYNLEEKDVNMDIGSTNGVRRRTEDVRRSILRELGWDDNLRPVFESNIFLSPDLNNTNTREELMETTNESVTKLSRSLKKSLEATTPPLSIIKKSVVSPNSSFIQKSKPFLIESSTTTPKRLSSEKASHIHVKDTLQCDSFMANSMSSATLKTSTRVRMVGTPRDSSLSIPNNGAKTPTLRRKDNLRVSSTSKSITKDKSTTHRFAKKHAKLFAEMESLDDHKIKIERRHQNNMRAATDFVKRLATPKALIGRERTANLTSETRTSGYKFDASCTAMTLCEGSFAFGKTTVDDIEKVQKKYVPHTPVTKQENVKAVKGNNQRDVKSRTKNTGKPMRSLLSNSTAPLDNNFLSTPGKVPRKSSYTPHRGVVGNYIDTTKLTDREFELAVKSGIIKGKNTRKSSIQITQILRTKRRDEILDLKRKLNVKNN